MAAENYESISIRFANVFNEINHLIENPTLTINGIDYQVGVFYMQ